jgi:hypothetical protein
VSACFPVPHSFVTLLALPVLCCLCCADTFFGNQLAGLIRDLLRYPLRMSHFYKQKLVSPSSLGAEKSHSAYHFRGFQLNPAVAFARCIIPCCTCLFVDPVKDDSEAVLFACALFLGCQSLHCVSGQNCSA